jgi:hypothetical protein
MDGNGYVNLGELGFTSTCSHQYSPSKPPKGTQSVQVHQERGPLATDSESNHVKSKQTSHTKAFRVIESTPFRMFLQRDRCSESSNQCDYVGLHRSTGLSYRLVVQSWVFYPGIASICRLLSHGGLGPCYSHGPFTYNDWLIILLFPCNLLVGGVLLRYTLLRVA